MPSGFYTPTSSRSRGFLIDLAWSDVMMGFLEGEVYPFNRPSSWRNLRIFPPLSASRPNIVLINR